MSGFDENLFGEPTVENPFADPSVTQVTKQTSNVQQGLEDYNPCADQGSQRVAPQVWGAANPPQYQPTQEIPPPPTCTKTAQQTQQPQLSAAKFQQVWGTANPPQYQPTQEIPPPPAYTKTAQQTQQPQLSAAKFQRRREELERKAAELARREEELRNAPFNMRHNNWPPFLENNCCGLQPCFYQDINVEIPPEFQPVVWNLYYLWMFHSALMLINCIGGILLVMLREEDIGILFVVIINTFLFTPFSFLCWYRPAYKAFRNDSSFNFMVFFFVFFFQLLMTIIQSLGLPGSGTCGLVTALTTLSVGTTSGLIFGLFLLLIALGFCSAAFMDLLLLTKIHRIYQSSGASFAKAQQEFTSEILHNEHVRNTAGSTVAAAIQAQFQQNQAPRNPSTQY